MTRGDASRASYGPVTRRARTPATGYSAYLDQARVRDDEHALGFLSGILTSPHGCAIFATDGGGTVLAWSRTAVTLFGYPPGSVLGQKKLADLIPGTGTAEDPAAPLAVAMGTGAWDGVLDCVTAGGERAPCQIMLNRLPGTAGTDAGVLVLACRATMQMRQRAELQKASGEALSLFAANPVPLLGTDTLGVITHANRGAEELLGRSRESLTGTRVSDCFTSPARARVVISRILHEGASSTAELDAARPDGTVLPVSLNAAAYQDTDGKPAGLVVSITDLTERNRSRAELQQSEAYHRGLIEGAGDGLVVVDSSGIVTDANGRACSLLSYPQPELTGAKLADRFAEPQHVMNMIGQALAGEPPEGGEFKVASGAGPVRWVLMSASALRIPAGPARVVLAMHDATGQARLRDRLAQERAYNRSIIEASANGLAIVDLRDEISDVNETLCAMTGRGRSELVGANVAGLFTDAGAATEAVHQALARSGTARRELNLATRDQPQVAVSASPVRGGAGEVTGVLISAGDISEQARLRRALTAEQAYNRALMDSAVSGLFTVTPEGGIADVNPAACRVTGRPHQHLIGHSFPSLFTDQQEARWALAHAFAEGAYATREFVLASAGPEPVHVTVRGGVFTDPRAGTSVLLAVMNDITEQRQAEERLRYYAGSLFEAVVDGFVTTDVLGVIVDANHPMEELTGRTLAEMTGRNFDEYFTEPRLARELLSTVLRQGKVTDFELTAVRPDGSTTVVSCSAATYTGGEGEVAGMLVAARDVTSRKQFEQMQASLLERARELDQAKSDFVSRVSHELRSPLTNVLGYLELIHTGEAGPLTGRQREMLEIVNRNGRRLLMLIEDLLLLSGIEGGGTPLAHEPVQLGTLVRTVAESFAPAFQQGQLTSRLDVDPGVQIDGDAGQLGRAVNSLLSNAVKFTPPGGHVEVACHRDGDEAIIQVRDTGIGIPEEEQPRLFTRFFRSAVATEQEAQGAGIGLFIVRYVTEAHGGSVGARSSPGKGSTFTVRLPVRAAGAPRTGRQETIAR